MCSFNTEEYNPWPTCKMHYDLVTAYESFYDWVWEGMSSPHAPVHFWFGGERNKAYRILHVYLPMLSSGSFDTCVGGGDAAAGGIGKMLVII